MLCSFAQLCLTLCDPMDCSLPGTSVHGILQARIWSELPSPPPGDLPNPGIEPRYSTLQAHSLPSEPPGKPKNTGVGSHSLLQGIFPTQGSSPGLLHCRQISYHLSHQGSPKDPLDLTSLCIKFSKASTSNPENMSDFNFLLHTFLDFKNILL